MAGGKKKSKHERAKRDKKTPTATPPPPVAASDESTDSSAASSVDTLTAEPARRGALTEMVPVRFDTQMLADVRARAASDHRSVSSWIRRAVDLELQREA